MNSEMWAQLRKLEDGDKLNAETLNVPIAQLGDRTAYLYARLKALQSGGKFSAVILTDVELATEEGRAPSVGNAVYLRRDGRFAAARATMSLYDDFTADNSAFTVGMLQAREGTKGSVILYGHLELSSSVTQVRAKDLIESGESFRPGRYYLSANEAGKLSAHPNGPLIYVCTISAEMTDDGSLNGSALVAPQFLDIGTSHVHRTAVLTARPAGTQSTAGYLPLVTRAGVQPLALRFGGTWTSDLPIDYQFYLDQESPNWPDGVYLKWYENGKFDERFKVQIPAPDVEVNVSNGLTVRLSLPNSTSTKAYDIADENERTWAPLTFPFAGRGWTDHESVAHAASSALPDLRVDVRGRVGRSKANLRVGFPRNTQILTMGNVQAGSEFEYDGVTYRFVSADSGDSDSSSSTDYIPVDLGPCLADSVRNLVVELNRAANGTFVVFESDSGASAQMLLMDGASVPAGGIVISKDEREQDGFTVRGASNILAVISDENFVVQTAEAILEGVSSYSWKSSGQVALLVYQDPAKGDVTVGAGFSVYGDMLDDAPDALYDYVIGLDAKVANFWPPVPAKSAALLVNGVEMDNQALVPDNPTVAFGRRTLHWFTNDEGHMPWPNGFIDRGVEIEPSADKVEILHWVRGFQGSTGPVTSLQSKPGSALKILGFGTEDTANTGDLEIDAELDLKIVGGGVPGFMVPKRAAGGRMLAGPVVERIIGGAGVSVISTAGCPAGQGSVVIALDNGAYVNQFSDIALENAEQSKIGMFPYVRLKGYSGAITSPSAFTATMRVPNNLPNIRYALKITASVFGESGFTGQAQQSACVKFGYNILPDFSATEEMRYRDLKTSLLKPDGDRTVLIPFGHSADGGIVYNGFDPLLVSTEDDELVDSNDIVAKVLGKQIPHRNDFALQEIIPELRPGYLVGIRFARAVTPQSDGVIPYTGAIGFINLSWSLVAAESYGNATPAQNDDIYARDASTGLYHAVTAVRSVKTGRVSLGIEQDGVRRRK